MKDKFFKIKTIRQPKLQPPPLLSLFKKMDIDMSPTRAPSGLRTSRTDHHSKKSEVNDEITNILSASFQLGQSLSKIRKHHQAKS